MKNKKTILTIWILVIIWLTAARFVINDISEKKYIWNTNPDSKSINLDDDIEYNYKIVESNNQSCTKEKDCETPSEYLIRSDCPYQSKCIQNVCTVICPNFEWEWWKIKKAIYDCEVESIFQNHANEVMALLKNGKKLQGNEPNIDDVFDIVKEAENKCGEIRMATE